MTGRNSKIALFDAVILDWAGTGLRVLCRYRPCEYLGNTASSPPWTRYKGHGHAENADHADHAEMERISGE